MKTPTNNYYYCRIIRMQYADALLECHNLKRNWSAYNPLEYPSH